MDIKLAKKIVSACPALLRRYASTSSNGCVNLFVYNRNPRNLERLRIAPKLQGYALDNKPTNFWNRLVIQKSNRHTSAHVEHFSGRVVVSASTQEWAIKKYLRSTLDVPAAKLIGRILAQRCLESGMLELHSSYEEAGVSQKVGLILDELKSAGVSLTEPEQYQPVRHWSREAKEKPWEVFEESSSH